MQQSRKLPYEFETGVYRPPSEGGASSLLLRLTRNCPWNHCTFCAMYKTEKFELRPVPQIIRDIRAMHDIYLELIQISKKHKTNGRLTPQVFTGFFNAHPNLYFDHGIAMLFNWLASGAKTVFLQDADSLIMKTPDLLEVLAVLRKTFPSIERITTYARSRTIARKPMEDLLSIYAAGLSRVHIGLETGDAALLKKIKKGATPEDHVKGGQKAKKAGFQVSEYWMPGLGGLELSDRHALETAAVLNEINPHYIRSRPFSLRPGSPMFEQMRTSYKKMPPGRQLSEIKLMVSALEVTSKVCFDHAGNYWKDAAGQLLLSHSYEGYQFPDQKNRLLEILEKGMNLGS